MKVVVLHLAISRITGMNEWFDLFISLPYRYILFCCFGPQFFFKLFFLSFFFFFVSYSVLSKVYYGAAVNTVHVDENLYKSFG